MATVINILNVCLQDNVHYNTEYCTIYHTISLYYQVYTVYAHNFAVHSSRRYMAMCQYWSLKKSCWLVQFKLGGGAMYSSKWHWGNSLKCLTHFITTTIIAGVLICPNKGNEIEHIEKVILQSYSNFLR